MRVFLLDGQTSAPGGVAAKTARSLGEVFAGLLRPDLVSGSIGKSVTLNDGKIIQVDWLILGDSDCFATFTGPPSHSPDYLLLLSRRDESLDARQLVWFVDRILKPLGLEPHEHVLRGIRLCESPSVVVASALNGTANDHVMEAAETAFAQAFLRAAGQRRLPNAPHNAGGGASLPKAR